MTPKDVSIRVLDTTTLSTANVPKDGIDLYKLSGESQRILSIFDKNGDGKLTKAEIDKAIMTLANADKTYSEEIGDKIITTKKNGVLDDVEVEALNYEVNRFNSDELNEYEATTRAFLEELKSKNNPETRASVRQAILRHERILDAISSQRAEKRAATANDVRAAAKIIQREWIAENEIKKNGLQRTYNENWLKDTQGNHYRYNEQTMKFEKVNNVEYVAKDGSYRTREKNEKGQQVLRTHAANYKGKIKVLNSENKAYVNSDYAAKVAGLEKLPGGYKASDGTLYTWDDKKYAFIE